MNSKERFIGFHVRLQKDLLEVMQAVDYLNLTAAQSFLINEEGAYVNLSPDSVHQFVNMKKKSGSAYFVHAAYWSSLVNVKSKEFITLCEEAQFASDLHSDGIVIHIGATRAKLDKREQVAYVAECVNELTARMPDLPLILENSPHAGRNFGGNLEDFGLLFEHIEYKDRVKFCLDTAHAFVFGYDLTNQKALDDFFLLITQVIGKEKIALLHLNDTPEHCGSYIDKHAVPGDGLLREHILRQVMNHDLFLGVPIILELPGTCLPDDETKILHKVTLWQK